MSNIDLQLVETRLMNDSDRSFVYATWLRGLYYGNVWFNQIHPDIYYKKYHKVIDAILNRANTYGMVCCLRDDNEIILSYAILEKIKSGNTLHWVFTKKAWRDIGLAKQVLPNDIKYVTHLTLVGLNIKPEDWEFDPFLI